MLLLSSVCFSCLYSNKKMIRIALLVGLFVSGSWADSETHSIRNNDNDKTQNTNFRSDNVGNEEDGTTNIGDSSIVTLNNETFNLEVAKKSHFVMFFVDR